MNVLLSLAALLALCLTVSSKTSPPKVMIYSRNPGEYGKENTLICHVSNFHPPDITIDLLCDGQPLANAKQTDLAFKQDWHFHLTKSAAFTPEASRKCSCRVTHGAKVTNHVYEPNM